MARYVGQTPRRCADARRPALASLVLGGALALSACLFPDLSGLTPPPNASSDGGALQDAFTDGAVESSSGSDAAAPADVSVTAPCAGGHAFCVDFDQSTDVLGGAWDAQRVDTNGQATVSSARALSLPNALELRMDRRSSTAPDAYAVVEKTFGGKLRRMLLEYDMYFEPTTWQAGDINSGFLVISFAGTNQDVTFSIGEDYFGMQSPGGTSSGNGAFPFGEWVHVRVDVDPVGGRLSASIGKGQLTKTWQGRSPDSGTGMFLSLGISGYNKPAPAFHVFYDNVVVDFP